MNDPVVDATTAVASHREDVARLATAAREEAAALRGGAALVATAPSPPLDTLDGVVVGRIGGVVVGYAWCELGASRARLRDLYCEPAARGVGVGAALLASVVEAARRSGAEALDSVALPGDRGTKNFFEAHGMVSRLLVVSRPLLGR